MLKDRIAHARKEAGLTQAELAAKVGKSESSINKYEAGQVLPPLTVLVGIAKATGVTTTQLVLTDAEIPEEDFQVQDFKVNFKKLDEHGRYVVKLIIDAELLRCYKENTVRTESSGDLL